jgi:hypothetical protein
LVFFCSLVRPLGEKLVAVSQMNYGSLGFRGDEFCGVTASLFGALPRGRYSSAVRSYHGPFALVARTN